MAERDAESTKVIFANLISIKSRKEDDLSQNGNKRAKDPTSLKTFLPPPVVKKLKKDQEFKLCLLYVLLIKFSAFP